MDDEPEVFTDMGPRTRPRVWSMPKVPGPEVRKLKDRHGKEWHWTGEDQFWRGPGQMEIFAVLLAHRGPLTEVVDET
jgi:hypothetical protein